MVALKVLRKWPLKLGNNCNPYTGDLIQWNVDRKCVFKIHKQIMQKFISSISFSTGIVDIDPMKRISPQVLTFLAIICHFWVLIYSWARNYCLSTKAPVFLQNCLTFNGGVQCETTSNTLFLMLFYRYLHHLKSITQERDWELMCAFYNLSFLNWFLNGIKNVWNSTLLLSNVVVDVVLGQRRFQCLHHNALRY